MKWINENKKKIIRASVKLNKEKCQDIYNELETDNVFCLDKKLVAKELGIDSDLLPRPQTLEKWIVNTIDMDKDYSIRVGESKQGLYIFRRD